VAARLDYAIHFCWDTGIEKRCGLWAFARTADFLRRRADLALSQQSRAQADYGSSTDMQHNQPMRAVPHDLLVALALVAILATFVAFPKESGDAMAQFIAATQRAVTAVIGRPDAKKSWQPPAQQIVTMKRSTPIILVAICVAALTILWVFQVVFGIWGRKPATTKNPDGGDAGQALRLAGTGSLVFEGCCVADANSQSRW
jgi:hypothetical protein